MSSNSQSASRRPLLNSFDSLEPLSLEDFDWEENLLEEDQSIEETQNHLRSVESMNPTETQIKETWLTRMPSPSALIVSTWTILVIALMTTFYWNDVLGLHSQMAASGTTVFANGEWWRLFSALLIHSDLGHLASNSLLFFVLGYFLYGYFGLSVFPIQAFLAGALTNAIVLMNYEPRIFLLGASGIVFWMGGMWLTMYLLLDRRRSVIQRMLRSFGVGLMLFFPAQAFDPSVSYLAHTVGFFLGIAWGLVYFFLHRKEFRAAEEVETTQTDGERNDLIAF